MNDAEGPKVTQPPKLRGAAPADMALADKKHLTSAKWHATIAPEDQERTMGLRRNTIDYVEYYCLGWR